MNYFYCVDDSSLHRSLMTQLIGSICEVNKVDDFEIIECGDGMAFIEAMTGRPPSLVMLDINMPVMDGLTALIKLRNYPLWQYAQAPVIIISSENEKVVRRLSEGARPAPKDEKKKADLLQRVIDRVSSNQEAEGKINSVLQACACLGMDPVKLAYSQGANLFLGKPLDMEEAVDKLSGYICN